MPLLRQKGLRWAVISIMRDPIQRTFAFFENVRDYTDAPIDLEAPDPQLVDTLRTLFFERFPHHQPGNGKRASWERYSTIRRGFGRPPGAGSGWLDRPGKYWLSSDRIRLRTSSKGR